MVNAVSSERPRVRADTLDDRSDGNMPRNRSFAVVNGRVRIVTQFCTEVARIADRFQLDFIIARGLQLNSGSIRSCGTVFLHRQQRSWLVVNRRDAIGRVNKELDVDRAVRDL